MEHIASTQCKSFFFSCKGTSAKFQSLIAHHQDRCLPKPLSHTADILPWFRRYGMTVYRSHSTIMQRLQLTHQHDIVLVWRSNNQQIHSRLRRSKFHRCSVESWKLMRLRSFSRNGLSLWLNGRQTACFLFQLSCRCSLCTSTSLLESTEDICWKTHRVRKNLIDSLITTFNM